MSQVFRSSDREQTVKNHSVQKVFVTGGTGYMGRRLIERLVGRGHEVTALARKGSEQKLPPNCKVVLGDALQKDSFAAQVAPADAFVQLVGVAHPSPSKAEQFRQIDLASVRASVAAAVEAHVPHFVYVSVAQPASMMKEYVAVRAEGESMIRAAGLNATFLRPWYVLGPGHYWPYLLLPGYWFFELLPSIRTTARRLGLVTLNQMIAALVDAVEHPPNGVRIVEVPEMKKRK